MVMYAANVPKPKLKKKQDETMDDDGYEGHVPEDKPMSVLEQLQQKHKQDQQAVYTLRKEMGYS